MKRNRLLLVMMSLVVFPASTNYKLEGFSFGNAGGGDAGSENYSVETNIGEMNSNKVGSSNYDLGAGLAFVRQSGVPRVPTLINDGDYYNKLRLIIDNSNSGAGSTEFPNDTKFAVAISKDDFVTTQYVKSDMTVGTSLTIADYLTYSVWGEATGSIIIGLEPSTTYKVKVKSMQGMYTESGYGVPVAASTEAVQLSFDIDIAATDIQTTPPYVINFGDLFPGSVITSTDKVWVSFETNATGGGSVFGYGQNAGLKSITTGYTILSTSGNLSSLSNGFGIQGVGATQASGGPVLIDAAYDLDGEVVGQIDGLVRQMLVTTSPVTSGRASFLAKAKSDNDVPSANDYSEILTVIAAANF